MFEKQLCNVYMTDGKVVCPECSGMALLQQERNCIWCVDCGRVFRISGVGVTEREILVKYTESSKNSIHSH